MKFPIFKILRIRNNMGKIDIKNFLRLFFMKIERHENANKKTKIKKINKIIGELGSINKIINVNDNKRRTEEII